MDLVERLRSGGIPIDLRHEAAAEIERLRAALKEIERMGEFPEEYNIGSAAAAAERALTAAIGTTKGE